MTHDMTTCTIVRQLLPLRVSDDLTVDETSLVDQHIRYCSSCRSLMQSYSDSVGSLRQAAEQPLVSDQRPSLWDRIEPRLGPAGRQRRMNLAWISTRQLIAACVGLFAVTLFLETMALSDPTMVAAPRNGQVLTPVGIGDTGVMSSGGSEEAILRPMLGLNVQEVDRTLARRLGLASTEGVVIVHVLPGSAADLAGLRSADVVLKIDDLDVRSPSHLAEMVGKHPAGSILTVQLVRDGRLIERKIQLGSPQSRTEDTDEAFRMRWEDIERYRAQVPRLATHHSTSIETQTT